MRTQAEIIAGLPRHLRRYVREQDYGHYSAQDHAVWRFIMRQLTRQLAETAHPVYFEGLAKTGIGLERIPSIDDMNAQLSELGWCALVVDGYIPTSVFSELQSRRVLAIALDMRSIDNIAYTPAPDIVHESAGHAPFIADVDYAEYLQRFGTVSLKAISTAADHRVFLAIRALSSLKESCCATPADLDAAQAELDAALAANDHSSEAARLGRLQWWTIEYGLVGTPEDYRIFGAGLLSSMGESQSCLDDTQVAKRVLTVDAVEQGYDITRPQPQLFVARNCLHLSQVLEVFADSMCFRRGGAESLRAAIQAATVCSARYSSGLEVGGVFDRVLTDAVGHAIYLHTTGPTQLAYAGQELTGHGPQRHAEGFGSPVGRLQGLPRCLSTYSVDELRQHGIACGSPVRLEFLSGIVVAGQLQRIVRDGGRNLLLSFTDCRVTAPDGECLFDPVWGDYDMAVGDSLPSVWGCAPDRERWSAWAGPEAEGPVPLASEPKLVDSRLEAIYVALRTLREQDRPDAGELDRLRARLAAFPQAWLPRLEWLELGAGLPGADKLRAELCDIGASLPAFRSLIDRGLALLDGTETRRSG